MQRRTTPLSFCAASFPKDEKNKDHSVHCNIALRIWHCAVFQIPEQERHILLRTESKNWFSTVLEAKSELIDV